MTHNIQISCQNNNCLDPVRRIAYKALLVAEQEWRSVAQSGSALVWGAKGRRFKSCRSDHLKLGIIKFIYAD